MSQDRRYGHLEDESLLQHFWHKNCSLCWGRIGCRGRFRLPSGRLSLAPLSKNTCLMIRGTLDCGPCQAETKQAAMTPTSWLLQPVCSNEQMCQMVWAI